MLGAHATLNDGPGAPASVRALGLCGASEPSFTHAEARYRAPRTYGEGVHLPFFTYAAELIDVDDRCRLMGSRDPDETYIDLQDAIHPFAPQLTRMTLSPTPSACSRHGVQSPDSTGSGGDLEAVIRHWRETAAARSGRCSSVRGSRIAPMSDSVRYRSSGCPLQQRTAEDWAPVRGDTNGNH